MLQGKHFNCPATASTMVPPVDFHQVLAQPPDSISGEYDRLFVRLVDRTQLNHPPTLLKGISSSLSAECPGNVSRNPPLDPCGSMKRRRFRNRETSLSSCVWPPGRPQSTRASRTEGRLRGCHLPARHAPSRVRRWTHLDPALQQASAVSRSRKQLTVFAAPKFSRALGLGSDWL